MTTNSFLLYCLDANWNYDYMEPSGKETDLYSVVLFSITLRYERMSTILQTQFSEFPWTKIIVFLNFINIWSKGSNG